MMKRGAWGAAALAAIVSSVWAAACDAKVDIEDGTGGSTSASTGAKSSGVVTAATGGVCAGFEDAEDQPKLVIRLRNDAGVPIFLPTTCAHPVFDIQELGGSPADVVYNYAGFCLQTCEDRQTQTQIDCAPCAPQSLRLEPGAVRELEWNRNGLQHGIAMPAACYEGSPDASCSRVVQAPAGDYMILATGYAECGSGACTCEPDSGICNGEATGNQATANVAKFALPEANVVEVTFGGCAFPCP